ncbi:plastocyanin/azurin family copper-binding protein [Halobacteria archaeon HArc-gm2]|nr:plastocyanin/azurin family copper-binding protein [Halobacteria archaeon HArc-gm2]
MAGETFWLYRFDETGVYDMLCAPHEIFGMVGRVVVGEASAGWMDDDEGGDDDAGDDTEETNGDDDGDDSSDDGNGDDDDADESGMTETGTSTEVSTPGEGGGTGPELRPPELTAALVFADPALDVDNIQEQGQVS